MRSWKLADCYQWVVLPALLALLGGCAPAQGPGKVDIPAASPTVECTSSTRPVVPDEPGVAGPWVVGARTVQLSNGHGKLLTTEIWYPAAPGSEAGTEKTRYQLKAFLPDADAAKIPDSADTFQPCDCYRDLPLDTSFGPYPVIVFIHGTASFRTQSLPQMLHWASRGFVVISADHPYIQLKDLKNNFLNALRARQARDAANLIKDLHDAPEAIAFLHGHIDLNRIGVSGHSAGGFAAGTLNNIPGVRVIIPMAASGVGDGAQQSTLVMGAVDDSIARYSGQATGYNRSVPIKRLVGIGNAGHLAFTEICALLPDQGGIIQVAENYGVKVPALLKTLGRDGCAATQLAPAAGWEIINYASTAAFEETLQCNGGSAGYLSQLPARFTDVVEYREALEPGLLE